jgi:hypothetical protein
MSDAPFAWAPPATGSAAPPPPPPPPQHPAPPVPPPPGAPAAGGWQQAPPPAAPAWPQAQAHPQQTWQPGAPAEPGEANVALWLAIGSLLCIGIVLGPIALWQAKVAQDKIRASGGALGGEGKVTAARIIAIVSIVLSAIWILLVVAGSSTETAIA